MDQQTLLELARLVSRQSTLLLVMAGMLLVGLIVLSVALTAIMRGLQGVATECAGGGPNDDESTRGARPSAKAISFKVKGIPMPDDLAASVAISLCLLGLLIYRGIEYFLMRRQMRRRANLFYHWAMAIGRRIDWNKVPPVEDAHIQDCHIAEAKVYPHLADHTD